MKPNKAATGVIWNTLQQYSSYFIKLIVQIILGRLLEPNEFGLITEVLVFINIAEVLSIGGLGTALIRKVDCDSLDISSVFFFNFFISLFLYLILFFTAPAIGKYYNQSQLSFVLRINGIIIYFSSGGSILSSVLFKKLELKKSFFCSLISVIISGIVAVFLAISGFGVWAIVWQSIIYSVLNYLLLLLATRINITVGFSIKRCLVLFDFSWKILLSSLLGVFNENAFNMFLGKTHGDEILGFFNRGNLFPHVIIGQIRTALSNVILPVLSPIQKKPDELAKRIIELSVAISLVIFPITFGLISISDTLVVVLLTKKWLPSVFFLRLECVFYCVISITIVINCGLNAIGRSDIGMKIEIVKLGLLLLSLYLFKTKDAILICWIRVIISILCATASVIFSRKLLHIKMGELAYRLFKPFFFSLVMGGIVLLLGKISINQLPRLIIQVVLGVCIYVMFLVCFMRKEFQILKDVITRNLHVSTD